jgi:hypothetical protein
MTEPVMLILGAAGGIVWLLAPALKRLTKSPITACTHRLEEA